jgi:hypothetical protein
VRPYLREPRVHRDPQRRHVLADLAEHHPALNAGQQPRGQHGGLGVRAQFPALAHPLQRVRQLAAQERLTAALPELAEWARREALPAEEEIATVRRLIGACENPLASLDPPDRAAVEDAIELLRKGRASLDTTFPAQFRGVVAQSAPALFPAVAAEARRAR